MAATCLQLYACVAPTGIVWYAVNGSVPYSAGCTIDQFIQGLGDRPVYARCLGDTWNTPLVVALYDYCQYRGGRVEAVGPGRVGGPAETPAGAARTIYCMQQAARARGPAGWRIVTQGEYVTYAIAARLGCHGFDGRVAELLEQHPAWRSLCFVHGLAIPAVAMLLAEIVDPRWFADADNPDRVSRLFAFLGLCPRIQQRVYSHGGGTCKRARRCTVVLQAWSSFPPQPETGGSTFLWRVREAVGGGALGDLRASQRFILFLYHSWLAGLYAGDKSIDGSLFDPELFFKNSDELQGYSKMLGVAD